MITSGLPPAEGAPSNGSGAWLLPFRATQSAACQGDSCTSYGRVSQKCGASFADPDGASRSYFKEWR